MKAIILAAGMASRLRPLTNDTPKCLLKIGQRCLLQRSIDALVANGITNFVFVTGYLHEMIDSFVGTTYPTLTCKFIYNDLYESTNNIYSLWLARAEAKNEDILLLDSDLLYDPRIITCVLEQKSPNVLTLIRHNLGEEEMKVVVDNNGIITEISKTCNPQMALGESLGIERMGKEYTSALYNELDGMINKENLKNVFYERAFERLLTQGHSYNVLDVTHFFSCELDTIEDFNTAKQKIPVELY